MPQQGEVTKYDFIDALRAVGLLPVVFVHTYLFYPPDPSFPVVLVTHAAYGVQLFYLVSPFTLFLSSKERARSGGLNSIDFFIRRFFRIAPLFYVAIAVYTALFYLDRGNAAHDGLQYWQAMFAPSGISWWHVPLVALFLNGWSPNTINAIVPVGWSIAVEMTFYMCVPFLFKNITTIRSAILFIVASLMLRAALVHLLAPAQGQTSSQDVLMSLFLYWWFFSQLPVFGLGILTFHLFRRMKPHSDRRLGVALVVASALLCLAFLRVETSVLFVPVHVWYGFSFMLLTLGLTLAPVRALVNPFTMWMGKVSFSVYLVHFIVLDTMFEMLPQGVPHVGRTLNLFLCFVMATSVSAAVAFVTYTYIEVPGMRLGKMLITRLSSRRSSFRPGLEGAL